MCKTLSIGSIGVGVHYTFSDAKVTFKRTFNRIKNKLKINGFFVVIVSFPFGKHD
jgi:hypothetical protein